jgi:hypothetical protein
VNARDPQETAIDTSRKRFLRLATRAAFALIAGLSLLEAASLLKNEQRAGPAIAIVVGGVVFAALLWCVIPRAALFPVALAGLVFPWVVVFFAFFAQVIGDTLALAIFLGAIALMFANAALALFGAAEAFTRRSTFWFGAFALLAIGLGAVAAGARAPWLNDTRPPARFDTVDEIAGTYGGVGIGDTPAEMKARLGDNEALGENDEFRPTGARDFTETPWFVPAGGGYAYEDVLYWLRPTDRGTDGRPASDGVVWGLELTSPGVETSRGVAIGDDLDAAGDAYPGLKCATSDRGEYGRSDYCYGRIAADRFLYFGGDPISSISVTQGPVGP